MAPYQARLCPLSSTMWPRLRLRKGNLDQLNQSIPFLFYIIEVEVKLLLSLYLTSDIRLALALTHWYTDRLCLPMPIDVVYTWVNGSDPVLIEQLTYYKLQAEACGDACIIIRKRACVRQGI